jgi:Na+-transporting methylmalonyl-CoA/oxaloacetate decarboxylase gamma subunit
MLAATLPPNPGLWDLLAYQGIGLAVVLTTLAALALICALLGRAFRAGAPAPVVRAPAPAAAPPPEAGIPPHHTVIIAAAVATLIQQPYRIAAVRHIEASPDWTRFMLSTWSVEGRAAIFSSHRTR